MKQASTPHGVHVFDGTTLCACADIGRRRSCRAPRCQSSKKYGSGPMLPADPHLLQACIIHQDTTLMLCHPTSLTHLQHPHCLLPPASPSPCAAASSPAHPPAPHTAESASPSHQTACQPHAGVSLLQTLVGTAARRAHFGRPRSLLVGHAELSASQ